MDVIFLDLQMENDQRCSGNILSLNFLQNAEQVLLRKKFACDLLNQFACKQRMKYQKPPHTIQEKATRAQL